MFPLLVLGPGVGEGQRGGGVEGLLMKEAYVRRKEKKY